MEEKGAASGMMDRPLGRAIVKLLLQEGRDIATVGRVYLICGENEVGTRFGGRPFYALTSGELGGFLDFG